MKNRTRTDWAKVEELRKEWETLARKSQIAADAVASSRFSSKEVQTAAVERYEEAFQAADAVYAEMMLAMGDPTYAAQLAKETKERDDAAARHERIQETRKEWGIFAPMVDKFLSKGP
jgi:hypothetical protein